MERMPAVREAARVVQGADPLAPALPRAVARAIDRESAHGLVAAARAQAVAFVVEARVEAVELVAERAMLSLDRLHQVEAAMAKQDPIKAERYAGYVEDFYAISRNEIRRMPREF